MSKKTKILLIILAIIVSVFIFEMYFAKQKTASKIVTVNSGNNSTTFSFSSSEEKLLKILMNLKFIKLDTDFFNSKIFKSLNDFSSELVPEESGRPNPFLPISKQPMPNN
ncbi:MAG TPA: hypothetical protein ENG99_00770 [bacterium]|nr:hypothetical protein [bacterium]